jgi:hypothetical protein
MVVCRSAITAIPAEHPSAATSVISVVPVVAARWYLFADGTTLNVSSTTAATRPDANRAVPTAMNRAAVGDAESTAANPNHHHPAPAATAADRTTRLLIAPLAPRDRSPASCCRCGSFMSSSSLSVVPPRSSRLRESAHRAVSLEDTIGDRAADLDRNPRDHADSDSVQFVAGYPVSPLVASASRSVRASRNVMRRGDGVLHSGGPLGDTLDEFTTEVWKAEVDQLSPE